MNIEKHLRRTEVLNSILALWAENENLSLSQLIYEFLPDLPVLDDSDIIETTKKFLKPKKLYFLLQVDPQNVSVLGGYDRKIVTPEEQADFFTKLEPLPSNVIIYTTSQMLSDAEYEGVKTTIEEMYQNQQLALKGDQQ